nr:immunoglobulin light chain junction region [Macaca mulatta]
CMQVLQAPFTF